MGQQFILKREKMNPVEQFPSVLFQLRGNNQSGSIFFCHGFTRYVLWRPNYPVTESKVRLNNNLDNFIF